MPVLPMISAPVTVRVPLDSSTFPEAALPIVSVEHNAGATDETVAVPPLTMNALSPKPGPGEGFQFAAALQLPEGTFHE